MLFARRVDPYRIIHTIHLFDTATDMADITYPTGTRDDHSQNSEHSVLTLQMESIHKNLPFKNLNERWLLNPTNLTQAETTLTVSFFKRKKF